MTKVLRSPPNEDIAKKALDAIGVASYTDLKGSFAERIERQLRLAGTTAVVFVELTPFGHCVEFICPEGTFDVEITY